MTTGRCICTTTPATFAFSLTCTANCIALGCANVQFFVDQVVNCAIANIAMCGGDMGCMGLEGVLTAANILGQTLDHVLAQYYGKCEQCQVVYERYRNKHEAEKET